MKKFIAIIAFAIAGSMSAHAAEAVLATEDLGKQIPVLQTEKTVVTQVVVGDDNQTFLMTTEQEVQGHVVVTPGMAKMAMPYRVALDSMPTVYSAEKQVHNGDVSAMQGNKMQFNKTGSFEPITAIPTPLRKVYFEYGDSVYFVEVTDTGVIPETVTLTYDLIEKATKVV